MGTLGTYLATLFDSPVTRNPNGFFCNCSLVSNQGNNVVGYAVGSLSGVGRTVYEGELTHYFSDRRWDDPNTLAREFNPFNPKSVDRTRVRVERTGPETIKVTLTALSWGNGQSEVQIVSLNNNVLFGTGPGAGAGTIAGYMIALSGPVAVPT